MKYININQKLKSNWRKNGQVLRTQRKISVKFLRTMAISTYLNIEAMKNLLGDEHYERFNNMLKNAGKKANYYVSRDSEEMTKMDLYDFYIIGRI